MGTMDKAVDFFPIAAHEGGRTRFRGGRGGGPGWAFVAAGVTIIAMTIWVFWNA